MRVFGHYSLVYFSREFLHLVAHLYQTQIQTLSTRTTATMNKLKSLFKKDQSESTPQSTSSAQSSSYSQGSSQQHQQQHQQQSQQPSATSFPASDAPSTGLEKADNAEGVVMHTTLGDITIALYSQQTPRVCCPSVYNLRSLTKYSRPARTLRPLLHEVATTTSSSTV